jgi:hypothetical protein
MVQVAGFIPVAFFSKKIYSIKTQTEPERGET